MAYTKNDVTNIYQGLKEFFDNIQNGVEIKIFDNASPPLLGDELKKLKEAPALQYFEKLEKKFDQLQQEISSDELSGNAIKQKLEEVLGKTINVQENTYEVIFSVDLAESKDFSTGLASKLGFSALKLITSGSAEIDLSLRSSRRTRD